MANRQIGWSQESNLLWQIGNQVDRLTGVISKASGGSTTVATKAEIDALIASNSLVPGSTYIITGVDVPLYGGTTIMLQAETTNKLTLAGHGIFYNPKYLNSQATYGNGYGIWNTYLSANIYSIVGGPFQSGETITSNNGAIGTFISNKLIVYINGDWDQSYSITGSISGATANISSIPANPSYPIGSNVIWGGKHWVNISGNVGSAVDKYTLSSSDWTAVPFNAIDYNVVADVIHYDYEHDMIIRRKDKWDNDVDGNYQVFVDFSSPDGYNLGNPIKDFQWGNGPEDFNTDDYIYIGVSANYVKDSYLECINFIGGYLWFSKLTTLAYMHNNIIDFESYVYDNTINNSGVYDNTLTDNSGFSGNNLSDVTKVFSNTLNTRSTINSNIFIYSQLYQNLLDVQSHIDNNEIKYDCYISDNKLSSNSLINKNYIFSHSISSNILELNSSFIENRLNGGSTYSNILNAAGINANNTYYGAFSENSMTYANISFNEISNGGIAYHTMIHNGANPYISSQISYNKLSNSYITGQYSANTILDDTQITYNVLNNSTFDFSTSGALVLKNIKNIEANYSDATSNISAATIIYGDYVKQMFKNSAGVTQLGYYNASNVFTVVNVNS